MYKNVKIIVRKEKFKFEDGNEIDKIRITNILDGCPILLSVEKTSKDLAKYALKLDVLEYGKDYILYDTNGSISKW